MSDPLGELVERLPERLRQQELTTRLGQKLCPGSHDPVWLGAAQCAWCRAQL